MEADELRTYFGQFGNILEVKLLYDKETGKKRGFGFIDFDDYDPVDKIICMVIMTIVHKYSGKFYMPKATFYLDPILLHFFAGAS